MSAAVPVAPGGLVAGKYRVERVLGQGGMGIVVAALHEQLQQRVAIKFLLPEVMANAEAVARFTREARAAARIQSEHVARVIDVGSLESGEPYMVMEYLDGLDLAALLERERTLTPDRAVSFVLQACEALSEAHVIGTVHRDLKPSNLFITRRADGSPCVKVLDFGISKATNPNDADGALTKTTGFLGSPFYVSPEQITSTRNVDARADIWALGVILYEALGGCIPFPGDNVMAIAAQILHGIPRSLRARRPDLPPALCDAVMRCLEKDREARFPNVSDLAQALGPFAPRGGMSVERISKILNVSTRPLPASPPTLVSGGGPSKPTVVEGGSTSGGHSAESSMRLPKRSRRMLVLGTAGATALFIVLVLVETMRSSTPPSAPPTAAARLNAASVSLDPPAVPTPLPDSVSLAELGGSQPVADPARPAHATMGTAAAPRATATTPSATASAIPSASAAASASAGAPTVFSRHNPLAVELK